jgi:hypothetical protein
MCFIWGGIGSGDNVREYLCLTSDGVHILTQQPLHNHLADLLRRGDPARIDAFFQRFTPEEACVQCLTLITETAAPAEYAHLLSARARERERRKERARVCQRDGESLPACERYTFMWSYAGRLSCQGDLPCSGHGALALWYAHTQ